ncbi:MAG: glycosyltransferase family 9 protein [Bryobacteraceae bacterium]|nr:glycosyltransferase family 9 protein [Bryobacteraceae bacterium]
MAGDNILVVRLGAMGDILHTLPAVASIKHSYPRSTVAWAVDPKWSFLLAENPFVDEILPLPRKRLGDIVSSVKLLRGRRFQTVIDFQGLIQSAIVATLVRPDQIFGFHYSELRERLAALFYSNPVQTRARHVVDKNLELAKAAGAANILHAFPLPAGKPEGQLPDGDFVLACPLAGWTSKQWPLEYYGRLGKRLESELGLPLVLNGPPESVPQFQKVPHVLSNGSGLQGLIHATRRATAVVGLDSGPLHLAAALEKPGVAIFGPTDPGRNGPYGSTFKVLRSQRAKTSYKRRAEIDPSMLDISPDDVFEALKAVIARPFRASRASV